MLHQRAQFLTGCRSLGSMKLQNRMGHFVNMLECNP